MIKTHLFYNKKTKKVSSQISILEIADCEKIICETCKKPIYSDEGCVDDGIVIGKHHHDYCY